MSDADTYKETYQVLKEVAGVIDEISDVKEAQVLEMLFGKRQAQIGSAILSNFSQAEAALKTMTNSAGSAEAEMGLATDSLDYKLNRMKETITGIYQSTVSQEFLGGLFDGSTGALETLQAIIDKLGLIPTLITAIGAVASMKGKGRPKRRVASKRPIYVKNAA